MVFFLSFSKQLCYNKEQLKRDGFMKKKNVDEFDCLDDYYEEDEGSNLFSQTVGTDLSDVRYEDFNKPTKVIEEDDDDDEVVYKEVKTTTHTTTKKRKKQKVSAVEAKLMENEGLMDFLTIFWIWFRRIGIAIMIILVAYYITKGLFTDLFRYILLLVVSFFFGFGFMALINKIMENR